MKKSAAIKDFCCAGIGYVVSVWIVACSFNMKSYTENLFKPEFVPRIVAGLLAMFSTLLLIKTLRVWKTAKDESNKEKSSVPFLKKWAPLLTFALLVLYLFSMPYLGFTISTMLYLYFQMLLLSPRIDKKAVVWDAIIAVIVALIVYWGFVHGFHLNLPLNRWRF